MLLLDPQWKNPFPFLFQFLDKSYIPYSLACDLPPFSKSGFSTLHCSHSVASNSLQSHGFQHTRLPCPVCHQLPEPTQTHVHHVGDAIQSSHPLSSPSPSPCLQSFPAWGSFLVSQLFALGGQSIAASASTSVLPMNTQAWSPFGWSVRSVQLLSHVRLFATPRTAACQAPCPSPTPGACSNLCPSSMVWTI